MLVPLVVGAVVLPYATLWASRSARVRRRAVALADRGWHRLVGVVGATVGLLTLGTSGTGGPTIPFVGGWGVTTLGVVTFAYVDLFVAAARMRSYPDDRALHYDLGSPTAWPVTSARIVSAWGVVVRRHRRLWPTLLASSVLLALGPQFVETTWWLALAADTFVLGLCCLPFPRLVALPASFVGAVESRSPIG